MEEAALIERVLAGDPAAEREMFDLHVDRLYRLAFRMTGDEDLASDCVQEIFVRAFDRLPGFRREAALGTWLHSIGVSVVLNALRKRKRTSGREVSLDAVSAQGMSSARSSPLLRDRLKEAIDALPEEQRLVFVMYEVEGYSHAEIASALDIPQGTSKARLHYARRKLRALLASVVEGIRLV
ncbi:MAG TPA: sigma-70 family RNA polymerase sigma factor [Longimicrobiales bacterium]|nr:sigma-70 family RNA polymerase sigma factor [Longimicrobiales bacterium]